MIPGIMAERAAGGATLYLESEMEEAEIRPCIGGEVAVVSARSPVGEGANQDAAALFALGGSRAVLAVADGVGGARAGAAASSTALRNVEASLPTDPGDDLRGAILDGIERANRAVIELGTGAATTLALVEVDAGWLRPYHVGDSAILLVGQRGKVKLQTVSHSPVGYAVESGLIDQDEAMHHADRHLISNMVGSSDMRIEVGPKLRLSSRDTLLLATDGLFDNLLAAEIVEYVRKGPLEKAADVLLATSRQRMAQPENGHPSKPDDLTFVMFRPVATRKRRRSRDG